MIEPGAPTHSARFHGTNTDLTSDGRLVHPTCFRNGPPLIVALHQLLGDRSGRVLEIGSGTGQHAAAFALALPGLEWWPSDPDPFHRKSAKAWQAFMRAPERSPIDLDAAGDWAAQPELSGLAPATAVFSMNVIHIAPFDVTKGIVAGAAKVLSPDGLLIFYGPFRIDGVHTGPGNETFDAGLRNDDPAWGVRDVADVTALAVRSGLALLDVRTMPADNRLVIYRHQP